ncbi:MAG: DNA repair protein RecN (Recombination protein N) [Bacteroidia bacterium]|jgi:DNA repair protein RecN (Recombination protein N)
MLTQLSIDNFVLIDSLRFEPKKGLNIITGETGAGKSILLGALGLILGERADSKSLLSMKKKCVIEGSFQIQEHQLHSFFEENDLDYFDQTILRREISESGRSRAFINDTPVSLPVMRSLGEHLVDIHSQHQTLKLSDPEFLFDWLDAVSNAESITLNYQKAFNQWQALQGEIKNLDEISSKENSEQDYYEFLFEELSKANLQAHESADLEAEQTLLENSEVIGSAISEANTLLIDSEDAAIDRIRQLSKTLLKLAPIGSDIEITARKLEECAIEMDDLLNTLSKAEEGLSSNPERLSEVNARVSLINHLLVKHKAESSDQLLVILEDISARLGSNTDLKNKLDQLRIQASSAESLAFDLAKKLHGQRLAKISDQTKTINLELLNLGLPNARVELAVQSKEGLDQYGCTDFQILFVSNKGMDLQPAHKVASGGELSRLVLVLKSLLASYKNLPSIIFDEIDTGVSGEIAFKMGDVMRRLSKDLQVISITHLPQIAGKGDHHYYVYKETDADRTRTYVRELNEGERVIELAKMLGGDAPTDAALSNAKELLQNNA